MVKNMLSERVKSLKEDLLTTKPSICVERARLVTEAYREYISEPAILKRAKILAYVLRNMSIYIGNKELIVGNHASKFRSTPIFPEYGSRWIIQEIDSFSTRSTDPIEITSEEKEDLLNILEFWKGKSFDEIAETHLPEEILDAVKSGILTVGSRNSATGHLVPNYPKLLSLGFSGLIAIIRDKLQGITVANQDDQKKVDFLIAATIVCEASIDFAERYALRAKELADSTIDTTRKSELLSIAEICSTVPKKPPESFQEALQFIWFVHLIIHIETNGHGNSFGRFDQYINPWYKKDVADGKIDRAQSMELIQCLWIKLTELFNLRDSFYSESFAGYPMWQNLVIGGQTIDGLDASNDISNLILEATNEVQTTQPSISLRYHNNISDQLFNKALEIVQKGMATPAFFNDNLIIPIILAKGATIEEARDWSIEGCVEPYVGGKTDGRPAAGYINVLKVLEVTLNNGIDPITGRYLGVRTKEENFNNLQDIIKAFNCQLSYFIKLMIEGYNLIGSLHAVNMPLPFASVLIDNCIQKCISIQEGGAKYSFSGCFIVGLANLADSLAAIHEIVFEKNLIDLKELNTLLKKNFQGNERMRQLLLNKIFI